jgi:hypothetical protein
MEEMFCYGRANALRDPPQRWGDDGFPVPRVRRFQAGYKIFERYEQCGLEGLSDRTRRPFRYANQLPAQVEAAIIAA